jgi:hypothetical protein
VEKIIDLLNDLSRAHWCGHFSCTERELIEAVQATRSIEVGVVGLYLATRFSPDFDLAPVGPLDPDGLAR